MHSFSENDFFIFKLIEVLTMQINDKRGNGGPNVRILEQATLCVVDRLLISCFQYQAFFQICLSKYEHLIRMKQTDIPL